MLLCNSVVAQVDSTLTSLLDSMVAEDQRWRGISRELENGREVGFDKETVSRNMQLTDSLNGSVIEALFHKYGFLGYDKVGKEGCTRFWLLVQHQDKDVEFQEAVLQQMKIEVDKGNAPALNYAYLFDRLAINRGEQQTYGTQVTLNPDSTSFEPKPVMDREGLNERRMEVGLPSIEDYIELMNTRYFGALKEH